MYSQAMRRAGGRWTRERLDAFLKDPGRVVPGTTMPFGGVPDDNSRRALIEFLSSASEEQLQRPPEPGI
jgi:cytochrome c